MRKAFELYPITPYERTYAPVSRADGANLTPEQVQDYIGQLKNMGISISTAGNGTYNGGSDDDGGNGGVSTSYGSTAPAGASLAELKAVIKDAIKESYEDKIVFSLFNTDFTQGDVAVINMMLNILAIVLAVIALAKQK